MFAVSVQVLLDLLKFYNHSQAPAIKTLDIKFIFS